MSRGRYCGACGEMDYSEWGDVPCACSLMAEQAAPQPTVEDYCAAYDHAYYGDDGPPPHGIGRCYCGERSYPFGGPPSTTTTAPGVTPAPS